MSNQNREVKEVYSCTLGCVSMDLTTITTFSESKAERLYKRRRNNRALVYSIGLQYQFVDSYKIMEEKAVYAWDQMACEIGGFIGLVIGSSFISLIEIVAYFILKIVYKIAWETLFLDTGYHKSCGNALGINRPLGLSKKNNTKELF